MFRGVVGCLLVLGLAGCHGGKDRDDPDPPATLTSIAVTPAAPTAQTLTSTLQFTATGTYSDGTTQNITASATWGSTSNAVASISAGGLATSNGGGTTTITATLSGVTGSTVYTVTPAMLTWDDTGWDTVYWQ